MNLTNFGEKVLSGSMACFRGMSTLDYTTSPRYQHGKVTDMFIEEANLNSDLGSQAKKNLF